MKTALVQANNNERYTSILRSTIGVLFVGTPHQGSRYANIADLAGKIAEAVSVGAYSRKAAISGLKKNCDSLYERASTFGNICKGVRVFGFYEARGTIIVELHSATTYIPGEILQSLDARHGDLCKFSDRQDPNYTKIRNALRELMRYTAPKKSPPVTRMTPPYPPTPPYMVYTQGYAANQPSYPSNTGIPRVPVPSPASERPAPELATSDNTHGSREGPQDLAGQRSPGADPQFRREYPNISASGRGYTSCPPQNHPLERSNGWPSVDASGSRERSRSRGRELPAKNAGSKVQPAVMPQPPPTSSSVPPMERPPPTPGPSSAYRTIRSEPTIPTVSEVVDDGGDRNLWTCDACMDTISSQEPRIHCTVCDDYDLCVRCYQLDRTSKSHNSAHRVRRIKRTMVCYPDDFCHPSEIVNPDVHSETGLPKWTIGENYTRWNHLRKVNSHDRYLVPNVSPGHYALHLYLHLKMSEKLTADLIRGLSDQNVGKLRVVVGFPKSKRDFLHTAYPEAASLKDSLFKAYDQKELVINPVTAITLIKFPETTVFNVNEADSEIGVLLQWTDMKGFKVCNDAIAQISIHQLRLEDLLEWQVQSSTTSTATRRTNDGSDSDGYGNTDEAANQVAEAFGMLVAGAVLEQAAAEERQAQLRKQREEEERRRQALRIALLLQEQEKERKAAEALRKLFGL